MRGGCSGCNFIYHRFSLIRGSTSYAVTDFDPYEEWASPLENQLFAETRHAETDIIGTQDDPAAFNGIQRRNADKSWSLASDLALQPVSTSRYHETWVDQPRWFRVWTFPL
jgi:hypothetical protein